MGQGLARSESGNLEYGVREMQSRNSVVEATKNNSASPASGLAQFMPMDHSSATGNGNQFKFGKSE